MTDGVCYGCTVIVVLYVPVRNTYHMYHILFLVIVGREKYESVWLCHRARESSALLFVGVLQDAGFLAISIRLFLVSAAVHRSRAGTWTRGKKGQGVEQTARFCFLFFLLFTFAKGLVLRRFKAFDTTKMWKVHVIRPAGESEKSVSGMPVGLKQSRWK